MRLGVGGGDTDPVEGGFTAAPRNAGEEEAERCGGGLAVHRGGGGVDVAWLGEEAAARIHAWGGGDGSGLGRRCARLGA